MGFIDFWNKLIFKPKEFFKEDFDGHSSPYLIFTVMVYGTANAIDRLDTQFAKNDLKGNLSAMDWLNQWPNYWLVATIGGLISGFFFYLLGSWFYNLRIKWSGGTRNSEKAKFLYLYPEFVPSLITIISTIAYMGSSTVPYDPNLPMTVGEAIGLILILSAVFYSVHISYVGVTTVTDVIKKKARLWFFILPLVFYGLVYVSLFTSLIYFMGDV